MQNPWKWGLTESNKHLSYTYTMADEEVVDAEAGTLSKQGSAVDHLRHLINIGWRPEQPVVQRFIEEHGLSDELDEIWAAKQKKDGYDFK